MAPSSDVRSFAVIHETDAAWLDLPAFDGRATTVTYRQPIDAETGCRNLVQRVLRVPAGRQPGAWTNPISEEVVFVVEGHGDATVAGESLALEPGSGLFIPPGDAYTYRADDRGDLLLVSVLSPQPHDDGHGAGTTSAEPSELPGLARTVHERDQEALPAGDDRFFKLLIDPRFGCRNVTQFVGFIDRSRAPFHTHTYEEVIYVLGGEGLVHIGDRAIPIGVGTSVYLAPGTPHCLENASTGMLRLLGVFSPAGSPADKREDDGG